MSFARSMLPSGVLPTAEELKAYRYSYPGFLFDAQCETVPGIAGDPFDRDAHIAFYETHNYKAAAYFRNTGRLLVLNLAVPGSYQTMCEFLGREPIAAGFPHLNASRPPVEQVRLADIEARIAELRRISACLARKPFLPPE
jgi:hypothetical protein